MKKFTILSSDIIIDEAYCKVEKQRVEFPDKSTGDWFIHHSNDAVIVIPQKETGEILLQKNYKHGGGEIVTEFCAGLVDDGETPEEAAARELREETGYSAESFEILGSVLANPTSSFMKYHFLIAKNIRKNSDQELEAAEQIEPFFVKDIAEARKVLTSSITSSASVAALSFWKNS